MPIFVDIWVGEKRLCLRAIRRRGPCGAQDRNWRGRYAAQSLCDSTAFQNLEYVFYQVVGVEVASRSSAMVWGCWPARDDCRCCSPPDSRAGLCLARFARPTRARSSSARFAATLSFPAGDHLRQDDVFARQETPAADGETGTETDVAARRRPGVPVNVPGGGLASGTLHCRVSRADRQYAAAWVPVTLDDQRYPFAHPRLATGRDHRHYRLVKVRLIFCDDRTGS